MALNRPWLTAVGGVFCHGFYYLLKNHLVRRFFEPLAQKPAAATANGVYHGPGREGKKNHFMESEERRTLSDGDVAEISVKLVSSVVCTITALVGILALWETADDVIHSKSTFLVPYIHLVIWYFVYDMYAMCESFSLRKLPREATLLQKWKTFARKKWSLLAHHLLLLGIAYPIAVNYRWRREMGDFVLANLLLRDLSNPCVLIAHILRITEVLGVRVLAAHVIKILFSFSMDQLNREKNFLFKVNGAVAIITFFVLRIINWPLVLLVYAYQHHQLDILATLKSLSPFCYAGMTTELALEMYWFSQILRIAFGSLKSMKRA